MISQLFITFLGWLALVFIGTNLIGMFIRGLVSNPEVDKLSTEGEKFIKKLIKEHRATERKVNIVALALIIVYLITLFYFWNIGVVVVALMIMVARLPDLLWEMKHGRAKIKDMPKIYMLTLLIMFVSFPILWYTLHL